MALASQTSLWSSCMMLRAWCRATDFVRSLWSMPGASGLRLVVTSPRPLIALAFMWTIGAPSIFAPTLTTCLIWPTTALAANPQLAAMLQQMLQGQAAPQPQRMSSTFPLAECPYPRLTLSRIQSARSGNIEVLVMNSSPSLWISSVLCENYPKQCVVRASRIPKTNHGTLAATRLTTIP